MARYTGPRRRVARRLGVDLPGLTTRTIEGREYAPGQHGFANARRRPRRSEFAVRLAEKQKLRLNYGLTEAQLRRFVEKAGAMPGPLGENLLALLERRLDNVAFRLGLAPTIPAARQLVRHGHVTVDGRRVDIPSYLVSPGQEVRAAAGSVDHLHVAAGAEQGPALQLPRYLERAPDGRGGRCLATPSRDDTPLPVRESLVVEFYAR